MPLQGVQRRKLFFTSRTVEIFLPNAVQVVGVIRDAEFGWAPAQETAKFFRLMIMAEVMNEVFLRTELLLADLTHEQVVRRAYVVHVLVQLRPSVEASKASLAFKFFIAQFCASNGFPVIVFVQQLQAD